MSDGTRPPRLLLAVALLAGPVAWAVHLVGGAVLAAAACGDQPAWPIDALTVATAGACGVGIVAAVRLGRRAGGGDEPRGQALHLLSFVGLVASVLSLALVVAEGVMHVWVPACAA